MIAEIEQFRVVRGTVLPLAAMLRDAAGNPVTGYDGTEPLTCKVWPGASLPVVASPVVTWEDPEEGEVAIMVEPAHTALLSSGRYRLVATLDDGGRTVAAYECVLVIVPGPPAGVGR